MKKTWLAGIVLVFVSMPAFSASGGKLSWFKDGSSVGAGFLGSPSSRLLSPTEYSSFGINLYNSSNANEGTFSRWETTSGWEANSVQVYGEFESFRPRPSSITAMDNSVLGRASTFGVRWQHRLSALNSFAVSAEFGDSAATTQLPLDMQDTRAALSWTSFLPSATRASITGSVFLGDEMAREDLYRHLGRRYYGFSVGGSLTLFQSHTPYVSFKMQRSIYDAQDDGLRVFPRSGDRSLLSAGWKWQVDRNFSLMAEASYGLGETPSSLDPYSLERGRILFGTRYGFK